MRTGPPHILAPAFRKGCRRRAAVRHTPAGSCVQRASSLDGAPFLMREAWQAAAAPCMGGHLPGTTRAFCKNFIADPVRVRYNNDREV